MFLWKCETYKTAYPNYTQMMFKGFVIQINLFSNKVVSGKRSSLFVPGDVPWEVDCVDALQDDVVGLHGVGAGEGGSA